MTRQVEDDPDYQAARRQEAAAEEERLVAIHDAMLSDRQPVSEQPLMFEPLNTHPHEVGFEQGHWICWVCRGHMCLEGDGGCKTSQAEQDEMQGKAHP